MQKQQIAQKNMKNKELNRFIYQLAFALPLSILSIDAAFATEQKFIPFFYAKITP
ncbi:hypothetical protein RintRC_4715 [Richelia intracellularis]|nr:hypothetical protein RintRC_4715 [Richelia intracellularis]